MFKETEESALYRKFLLQWKLRFRSRSDYQDGEGEEEGEERIKNKVYNTKTKQFEAKK